MENNPYQAPSSDLDKPTSESSSSVKGILYGSSIAFFGSLALGIAIGIAYTVILSNSGVPLEEIEAAVDNLNFTSMPGILVIVLVIPIMFLAGYVCAKKSVNHIYRDVTIVCLIGIALGYVFDDGSQYTIADEIVIYSASIFPVYLGAYIWKQKSS